MMGPKTKKVDAKSKSVKRVTSMPVTKAARSKNVTKTEPKMQLSADIDPSNNQHKNVEYDEVFSHEKEPIANDGPQIGKNIGKSRNYNIDETSSRILAERLELKKYLDAARLERNRLESYSQQLMSEVESLRMTRMRLGAGQQPLYGTLSSASSSLSSLIPLDQQQVQLQKLDVEQQQMPLSMMDVERQNIQLQKLDVEHQQMQKQNLDQELTQEQEQYQEQQNGQHQKYLQMQKLLQRQEKQADNDDHIEKEIIIGEVSLSEIVEPTLIEIQDGKESNLEKEIGSLINELDRSQTENAELVKKCSGLETEIIYLKAAADSSNRLLITRLENLEKENIDLKSELDDEIRVHSEEIENLSNKAQSALEKAEELEKQYVELKSQLTEEIRTRDQEIDKLTEQIRIALIEKNEAIQTRDEQHEFVTQQMTEIQRKDDFIMTIKCENESLYRKNKALERRIDVFENESKKAPPPWDMPNKEMSDDERAEFQIQYEKLHEILNELQEKYQHLLKVHAEEIQQTKLAIREKEMANEEHVKDYDQINQVYVNETEKMKNTIERKTHENGILRKENEELKKALEYYVQNNNVEYNEYFYDIE